MVREYEEKRAKLPTAIVIVTTAILTAALLLVGGIFLLGRDGLGVVQGWLLVRWTFVEKDADLTQAANQALDGMVEGLGDRWSYYVDQEGYAALKESRSNQYVGIGITVAFSREEGLLVIQINPEGPADQAGVQVGDVITAVDGVSVAGEARQAGVELIGGPPGTQQVLTLLSPQGSSREVTVTLDYVTVTTVKGELLENGMGLVTIANFNSGAAKEFKEVVTQLMDQGATALLFDVRGNGGGYVTELTTMLDFLLPEGDIFRHDPRWQPVEVTTSDAACVELPFGVLVDTGSYSAAELFSAQLRESAGAPIVGQVTSGKGYSQQTIPLANGGALGLSTAQYTTGGGLSLIGIGITPDVERDLTAEQTALLRAGTLERAEDAQLLALIEQMEKT